MRPIRGHLQQRIVGGITYKVIIGAEHTLILAQPFRMFHIIGAFDLF
jgi:hypothetical protein